MGSREHKEQGEVLGVVGKILGNCREEQRGIANGGRVWRRFHFALAGLTIASVRKRTWKIANRRGESGWVPDQEGCRIFPHQDRRGTYRGDPAAIVQTMWGTAA